MPPWRAPEPGGRPAVAQGVNPGRKQRWAGASLAAHHLLGALLGVTLLGGCASGGGLSLGPRPAPGTEPWQIPAGAHPTQRLYRIHYEGPEEKASFKLTLYLATADRYRMAAADGLGRKLWTLEVVPDGGPPGGGTPGGEAIWLDHRRREYCRARSAHRLTLVPLARLPLRALPRLLLGRLPAEPAADLYRSASHLSYLDARGQRWAAGMRDGRLDWWSLGEGGEALAWWRRDLDGGGEGGEFTDRRGRQTIRWREIVREPFSAELEPLEIPPRFTEGACAAAR